MGYLDDYVNNATKMHIKKHPKCLDELIRLIRYNAFNPSNPNHVRWKNVGIKYGYIDNDLNILKGD